MGGVRTRVVEDSCWRTQTVPGVVTTYIICACSLMKCNVRYLHMQI